MKKSEVSIEAELPGKTNVLKDKTIFHILLTGQVRYLAEMPTR